MIDEIRFSDAGERATEFERRLVAQAGAAENEWLDLARRMMAVVGEDAGLRAFLVLLDEMGGGEVSVCKRGKFFQRLWTAERDALIVNMATRESDPWSQAEIARLLGVSAPYVHKVLRRKLGRETRGGAA